MKTKHKLLIGLTALIAVGATTLFRTASPNAIYIQYRADGRAGTGSFTDPYDGSTAARLALRLSNAPAGAQIYFFPSTNYTLKLSSGATNVWQPKNGQSLIGLGGMEAVKITAATNTVLHANKVAFFYSDTGVTNFTVRGITFDNNINYFNRFATSNVWTNLYIGAGHVSEVAGDNIEFRECRIMGFWGGFSNQQPNSSECFPVYLGSTCPVMTNYNQTFVQYKGNRLIDSEVIQTASLTNIWRYAQNVVFGGYSGAGSNAAGVYSSNKHLFGRSVARGNRLVSTDGMQGLRFSTSAGTIVENNTVINGRLIYNDTWMNKDVVVRNNHVLGNPDVLLVDGVNVGGDSNTILMDFVYTTNAINPGDSFYERVEDIEITGNTFDCSRRRGLAGGIPSEAIIRFYHNVETNTGTGAHLCASNIVISGNTFIGSSNASIGAIWGKLKDSRITGNTFKNLNIGIESRWLMDNVLIQGNSFENMGYGILNYPYGTTNPPVLRRNISVIGNTAKNITLSFFLGGGDNLLFDGNSVHDYSFTGISVGSYYSAAIWITTNGPYTGTSPRNFTNVVIKNNILWNTTNAVARDYSIQLGGVDNFTVVDNPHNANVGLVLGMHASTETYGGTRQINGDTVASSATTDAALTNVAKYLRVRVGATNFYLPLTYTNINDLGSGGGSGNVSTDTIWDAAGDLAVGTGANTAGRLAIGGAAQVLTSTGLTAAWSNSVAGAGSDAVLSNAFIAGSNLFASQIALAQTNLFIGKSLYVATNGADGSAQRDSLVNKYATFQHAMSNAVSGDTVFLGPGTNWFLGGYSTNVAKANVSLQLSAGSVVYATNTSPFHDALAAITNFSIAGPGDLIWRPSHESDSNAIISSTAHFISFTNPASSFDVDVRDIIYRPQFQHQGSESLIYSDDANVSIRARDIIMDSQDTDIIATYIFNWQGDGDASIHARKLWNLSTNGFATQGAYGVVWANQTTNANLYVTADEIRADYPIYGQSSAAAGNNARVWVNVPNIVSTENEALWNQQAGFLYASGQKIYSPSDLFRFNNAGNNYVTYQKAEVGLTSLGTGYIPFAAGTNRVQLMEVFDTGNTSTGILSSGTGETDIWIGNWTANPTNNKAFVPIGVNGANHALRVWSGYFNGTNATNRGSFPVLVASAGLSLGDVVLLGNTNVGKSITNSPAGTARSVELLGTVRANLPIADNIRITAPRYAYFGPTNFIDGGTNWTLGVLITNGTESVLLGVTTGGNLTANGVPLASGGNFNISQFETNGGIVQIKSSAAVTNPVLSGSAFLTNSPTMYIEQGFGLRQRGSSNQSVVFQNGYLGLAGGGGAYFNVGSGSEITANLNLVVLGSQTNKGFIMTTNGYLRQWSTIPSSNVVWVSFANTTNEWQLANISANSTIGITNLTAGVTKELRLEVTSGGPYTLAWPHAFNNATTLPEAITNGNVYVIAFECWDGTTNRLQGAGRFFR